MVRANYGVCAVRSVSMAAVALLLGFGGVLFAAPIPEAMKLKEDEIQIVDFGQAAARVTASSATVAVKLINNDTCLQVTGRREGTATVTYELRDGAKGTIGVTVGRIVREDVDRAKKLLDRMVADVPGINRIEIVADVVEVEGAIVAVRDWAAWRRAKARLEQQGLAGCVDCIVVFKPPADRILQALRAAVDGADAGIYQSTVALDIGEDGVFTVGLGGLVADSQVGGIYLERVKKAAERLGVEGDMLQLNKNFRTVDAAQGELGQILSQRPEVCRIAVQIARGLEGKGVSFIVSGVLRDDKAKEQVTTAIGRYAEHDLKLPQSGHSVNTDKCTTPARIAQALGAAIPVSDPGVHHVSLTVDVGDEGACAVKLGGLVADDQVGEICEAAVRTAAERLGISADAVQLTKELKTVAGAQAILAGFLNQRSDVCLAAVRVSPTLDPKGVQFGFSGVFQDESAKGKAKQVIDRYAGHTLGLAKGAFSVTEASSFTPALIQQHLTQLPALADHTVSVAFRNGVADVSVRGSVGDQAQMEKAKSAVNQYFQSMKLDGMTCQYDLSVSDQLIEVEVIQYLLSDSFDKNVGTNLLEALDVNLNGNVVSQTGTSPTYTLNGGFSINKLFDFFDSNGFRAGKEGQTIQVRNGEKGTSFVGRKLMVKVTGDEGEGSVEEISVGFDVSVTPVIKAGDKVSLDVEATIRSLGDYNPQSATYEVQESSVTTTHEIKFNHWAALSTNRAEVTAAGKSGVPGIRKVWPLSWIAGSKTKDRRKSTWILVVIPRKTDVTYTEEASVSAETEQVIAKIKAKMAEGKTWK